MSDEQSDKAFFTEEEIGAVMNWAIGTGAFLHFLHDTDLVEENGHTDYLERMVARSDDAVETMYHEMPNCLIPMTSKICQQHIDAALDEDDIIQHFREQLDEFEGMPPDEHS